MQNSHNLSTFDRFVVALTHTSYANPAVNPDGSTVYFRSATGVVFAIDTAFPGRQRWNRSVGNGEHSGPVLSPDGLAVYVGSQRENYAGSGNLTALWAVNGTHIWARPFVVEDADVRADPEVSSDGGTIYVGSWNGEIYAVSAATGLQIWRWYVRCNPYY